MAPRLAQKPAVPPPKPVIDIDDYDLDDVIHPFPESGDEEPSKKRKDASGLGIDEAVSVNKKARIPRVKLDEDKLLSENGIPKLRRKARNLHFKGKGHEFSDTARLLSFYQLWLDDLFPKAKFLDALGMVEKAGHKKRLQVKRVEWIGEGRPRTSGLEKADDLFGELDQPEERAPAIFPAPLAPIFKNAGSGDRPKTPVRQNPLDDEEDIYDATPRRPANAASATTSLFGNGGIAQRDDEPDEDELDALMAEEEAQRTTSTSIFGNGRMARPRLEPDEDDLDALMAEAEAEVSTTKPVKPAGLGPKKAVVDDDGDDIDALMAEAEALDSQASGRPSHGLNTNKGATAANHDVDEDEEAAMAEMDGLW